LVVLETLRKIAQVRGRDCRSSRFVGFVAVRIFWYAESTIKREVTNLEDRLDRIDMQLTQLVGHIAKLQASVNDGFTEVNRCLNAVEQRLDAVEHRLECLEEKTTAVTTGLDKLRSETKALWKENTLRREEIAGRLQIMETEFEKTLIKS
jgi:chromosome segregation ATPase